MGGEGQLGPEPLTPASQVLKPSCLCPRFLLASPSNKGKRGRGEGVEELRHPGQGASFM